MKPQQNVRELKERCLGELAEVLPRYEERLREIDERVWEYAQDVCRTDIDIHNLDEVLGLRKFLRLLDTYEFDHEAVHDVIFDAEGEWETVNSEQLTVNNGHAAHGQLVHVEGGLKIDGIYGYGHYRQTPMQVFSYAWIYGFRVWKDTTSQIGSRTMLDTEESRADGHIWDKRRLVSNFVLMWPRKVAKTFTGAFVQFEELMRGERDFEGYIAANAADQSKLLFDQLKGMIIQLDGWQRYFKVTNSPQDRTIAWKDSTGRKAFVRAMTAGGKTKDGLKAGVLSADEFGAAQRVSGKIADMEGLVHVIEGSMGPRREPLTVHTSTAGLGVETPYEMMINSIHDSLVEEMEIPLDGEPHPRPDDWQGCIILRPDEWERDNEAELRTERVIRKVNPNLGVTVQPDFYLKEWASADKDGDGKRKEVITKLYNIFASDRAVDWVQPDEIRRLQVPMRIEDCKATDGWIVLTGMDYTNVGDDFQASTYMAVRATPNGGREFFADCDCWVCEDAVQQSPLRSLFEQWGREGWLHIVPSKVLSPQLPVDRIVSLRNDHGVNMMGFGYDSFNSKEPINLLKSWVVGMGVKPQDLGNYIMPVSQTFGGMSPLVDELTFLIRDEHRLLTFSPSPLWPWMAGNCQLIEETTYQNHKLIKTRAEGKVDAIQALCNALAVYDVMSGKVM